MKSFKSGHYSIVLGLMMFTSVSVSAQSKVNFFSETIPVKNNLITTFSDFLKSSRKEPLDSEANVIMRPLKEDVYSMHQGDWFLESNNVYEYDIKGRRIKEVLTRRDDMGQDVHTRISLKYNDDGMVSEFLEENAVDNQPFIVNRNTFNEYDAVRKNIQVLQKVYVWDESSESWDYRPNDVANLFREIIRDEQGRVTNNQLWSNEERFTPYTGYEFEYGESGAATKMYLISPDDDGYLLRTFLFEDLVWHKSDCQYLKMSNNVMHTFTKDPYNQISSFTIYTCNQNGDKMEWAGNYKASYDEQDRLVRADIRMPYDMGSDQKYFSQIAYDTKGKGSVVRIEKNWVDQNDNDVYDITEQLLDDVKYIYNVDDKGNPISEEWYQGDVNGSYVQVSGMKYETEYTDFGAIKQRISYTFNPETQKYEYLSKAVYSNFIDVVAGMESVACNKVIKVGANGMETKGMNGEHYIVSDVQGRIMLSGIVSGSLINLSTLSEGIYVVRIGNSCIKIIR